MPARKKIEKENIIDTCLKIIRKEGIDALNARKVAKSIRVFNTTFVLLL